MFICLRDKPFLIVVVVMPLVVIMKEPAIGFERNDLSTVYITCGLVGRQRKKQDVVDGQYNLIFISPEHLPMKWYIGKKCCIQSHT